MQLLRFLNPRVRTLMISSVLCVVSSLPFVGCSDDAVAPPEDPASLVMVRFPSSHSAAFHYYAEGDTILFELSSKNHRLEVVGGKVCTDGVPVLEFDRIDSTKYDTSVGYFVDYKTPLEQVSTLSEDGRTIRCVLPNIPAESLVPTNHHIWYIHLSRATDSEYGDRSGAFFMEQ
jgi:hypothetical protein